MTNLRIGHGYDVHKLVAGRKLILGGVDIPHPTGLDGHSDADVVVHALMDALLGAACLGDIGKLFPPSDMQYKNIDSLLLAARVKKALADAGFSIVNMDCTILCQKPKLAPFIDKMRANIAESCKIDVDAVSVKATTEEKLGFTGEGLGISAHAVVLID